MIHGYKGFAKVKDPEIRKAVETANRVLPVRLRGLREASGVSCGDVAAEIGCAVQAVSAYETGDQVPSLMALVALAAFYGVAVDELLWREDAGV